MKDAKIKDTFIVPGEVAIGYDLKVKTILGSCVAVYLRDKKTGLAGVNHFVLPKSPDGAGNFNLRYGEPSMEFLLDTFINKKVDLNNCVASIFGGGFFFGLEDIGRLNVEFAFSFLENNKIKIEREDVLGDFSRRLEIDFKLNKVKIKKIKRELGND